MRRAGIEAGEPALLVAQLIDSLPNVVLEGLQSYDGQAAHTAPFAARGDRTNANMARAVETKAMIERAGGDIVAQPEDADVAVFNSCAVTAEAAAVVPGRQSPQRRWLAWLAIAVLAALLRGLFPTADPPWRATVGVVWHLGGAVPAQVQRRQVVTLVEPGVAELPPEAPRGLRPAVHEQHDRRVRTGGCLIDRQPGAVGAPALPRPALRPCGHRPAG